MPEPKTPPPILADAVEKEMDDAFDAFESKEPGYNQKIRDAFARVRALIEAEQKRLTADWLQEYAKGVNEQLDARKAERERAVREMQALKLPTPFTGCSVDQQREHGAYNAGIDVCIKLLRGEGPT